MNKPALEMSFRGKHPTAPGPAPELSKNKCHKTKTMRPTLKLQLLDHLERHGKYQKITEKSKKLS